MYSHAPENYSCPFCGIVSDCRANGIEHSLHAAVYQDDVLTVLVPLHHFAGIKGNVIMITNEHYENVFDIEPCVGSDILRVTKRIALAMKRQFGCDGISTRQHNEPAGNQDVWHYHVHVFPRYDGDRLYHGPKALYDSGEREYYAALLRSGIK